MKRVQIIISGLVQGVGYRIWMKKNALDLGLTGWVKNRSDGKVEAVIEGKSESVTMLVHLVKHGPDAAKVVKLEIYPEAYNGEFSDFDTL